MAVATLSFSLLKSGLLSGGALGPTAFPNFVNNSAPDNLTTQAFTAATFAAVVVPTGANGCVIVPPSGYGGTITLKGITGDTGIPIPATTPFPLISTSGIAFGLLCSANVTLEFLWF